MPNPTHFLIPLVLVLYFMSFVFIVAEIKRDNSIVDIAWGLGFIIIAAYSLLSTGNLYPRQILVTLLVTIWGFRLATHIFLRKLGKPEDWRYANLRSKWGNKAILRSYLQIFMFQGLLIFLMSTPIILINNSISTELTVFDNLGLVIWSLGFVIESLADHQLAAFKKDPRNHTKVLRDGLWQYSRHPNYFGEVLIWWGIFIISLSVPHGTFGLISPALITMLILYFSGVPLLEQKYKDSEKYTDYVRKTSKFIPWFPKA